jgi:hypothetical protein
MLQLHAQESSHEQSTQESITKIKHRVILRGKEMANNDLQRRRALYFKLSSDITQIDNTQLRSLFKDSQAQAGWGKHHTLTIGELKVFVKRVPVTDIEYDNLFSTKNLYDLPMYYHYGVGSAGFGVFRELVTHIKTTNWVLAGAIVTFPLMYHYRIIPFSGARAKILVR